MVQRVCVVGGGGACCCTRRCLVAVHGGPSSRVARQPPAPAASRPQVIEETHKMYVNLKSGKRANDEELSLI